MVAAADGQLEQMMKRMVLLMLMLLATSAAAETQIPSRLECSPLSTDAKSTRFGAALPLIFANGTFKGERTTAKYPGKEYFYGILDQNEVINITGRGAYESGSDSWRSAFSGSLKHGDVTVLRGFLETKRKMGRRDCSITFLMPTEQLIALLKPSTPQRAPESNRPTNLGEATERPAVSATPATGRPSVSLNARSRYSVDGVAIGDKVEFGSTAFTEYACVLSTQHPGFTRCQRQKNERSSRGAYTSTYSILHSADGTVTYINRFLEPAWFSENEVNDDIGRLTKKFGTPPKLIKIPVNSIGQVGLIALWGEIVLTPLGPNDISQLAAGNQISAGLLVDHLGNFRRSAELNLPLYQLAGGPGFAWIANWDQSGAGSLRFLASDMRFARKKPDEPPIAEQSSKSEQPPIALAAKFRFSSLLETPPACEQLRQAQSRLSSTNYPAVCPLVPQCRLQLNERAAAVDGYLKDNPEVLQFLNKNASRLIGDTRSSPNLRSIQSITRDFGAALLKATIPNSGDCGYDHQYIHQYWISLYDGPSYQGPRPFEVWVSAGKVLLSDFRNSLVEDERTYSSLLAGTDIYPERDVLTSNFSVYKNAILAEEFESALRARPALDKAFEAGKKRKLFLEQQVATIESDRRLVEDWSGQLARQLAPIANASIVSVVQELTFDIDNLSKRRLGAPIDVAPYLAAIDGRIEAARRKIEPLIETMKRANELSDARASLVIAVADVSQKLASVPNLRLVASSQQKAAELNDISAALAKFRPENRDTQPQLQAMLDNTNATLSELRTASSQQLDMDDLTAKIEILKSKISSRGANLLDVKTGKAVADLLVQEQALKGAQFPLNEDQLRASANLRISLQQLSPNIDAALDAGERRQEVRRLGDQYARDNGTRWKLEQKTNPMTDKIDLKVSSAQKNEEGAVVEVDAKCLKPYVVAFTALIVDANGKPTISFPQYDPAAGILIGNRRINSEDPKTAVFQSDQYNNRFIILLVLGQDAQTAQAEAPRADDIWRALVQIETSQGAVILKLPMFDPTVKKLIDTCT